MRLHRRTSIKVDKKEHKINTLEISETGEPLCSSGVGGCGLFGVPTRVTEVGDLDQGRTPHAHLARWTGFRCRSGPAASGRGYIFPASLR